MDRTNPLRPDPLEVGRWLRANRAEAERWLPRLLDLSGPELRRELARHPELQPGISLRLLAVVEDTAGRHPVRAHELSAVVLESALSDMSLPHASMAPHLRSQAWTAHAAALRGIGRHVEALEAVAAAFDACRATPVNAWHIAAAEVVEAQILHDMGERAEALRLIRSAAEVILLHGAVERYVQVRMSEAQMHWEAGDRAAAADVWSTTAEEASQRRDAELMTFLGKAIADFQLRHGGAGAAACLFEIAHDAFDHAGLAQEAVRARRGVAEAAFARGRFHEAISEYYKVQALSLAAGNVLEAALASADIAELLLLAGREGEILPLAGFLVTTFDEEGQENVRQAWIFVRELARAGALTRGAVDHVRRFFRDLPLRPNAPFE